MRKSPSILVPLLVVITLALGSLQGVRVGHLAESEKFYRWILSASTQMRVFGNPGQPPPGEDPARYVDNELFAQLVELTDQVLPDVPIAEQDYDKQTGQPLAKVVRYTAAPITETQATSTNVDPEAGQQEGLGAGEQEIYTEEQRQRDLALWRFAQSDAAAPLRKRLLTEYKAGRVAGFGSQLGIAGLYNYEERGTNINLANMFFGFRKMAANLVWLEVDRYWHKGMMHRMLPLMKTCVTLDPTFIDAYLLGAWHMAYNATAQYDVTPWELREYDPEHEYWVGEKEQYFFYGVDFLKDGIRKNPRNYRLYFDLGYGIYEEKLEDHVNAIKYLEQATRLNHDIWVRRQLFRIQGLNGQFEKSKSGWERYAKDWPSNPIAPRFVRLMEGEILDRDSTYAGYSAVAAETLAQRAEARGDAAAAAEWRAKATEKRAAARELFEKAKAHWQSMLLPPDAPASDQDTYAESRLLRIEALNLKSEGRFEEAAAALETARWKSNEFWNTATAMMIQTKQEGNLPLAVTELRYLEREAERLEYTRHMPQSVAGVLYRFVNGTWFSTEYRNEPLTPIDQDSDELLKLQYEHPEIVPPLEKLDGNIILRAGDTWYEYRSKEPAKPSKLNPYIAARQ